MVIPKDVLGLAGEFAVASELCRRGIYAQLTLGPRKRTDLLVETDQKMIRVQVKAKQGKVWPGVKGIHGPDIILILVDYQDKQDTERPGFFILLPTDWDQLLTNELRNKGKVESGEVTISETNVPTFRDGHVGMAITEAQVESFKEAWDKLKDLLSGAA